MAVVVDVSLSTRTRFSLRPTAKSSRGLCVIGALQAIDDVLSSVEKLGQAVAGRICRVPRTRWEYSRRFRSLGKSFERSETLVWNDLLLGRVKMGGKARKGFFSSLME